MRGKRQFIIDVLKTLTLKVQSWYFNLAPEHPYSFISTCYDWNDLLGKQDFQEIGLLSDRWQQMIM